MTVYACDMKRNLRSLIIWSLAVGGMIMICILMFPGMKNETEKMGAMFSNMGSFTAAFGMDKLDFGQLMGFYGIECGNTLGIGGGMFAALAGISALANEEKLRRQFEEMTGGEVGYVSTSSFVPSKEIQKKSH